MFGLINQELNRCSLFFWVSKDDGKPSESFGDFSFFSANLHFLQPRRVTLLKRQKSKQILSFRFELSESDEAATIEIGHSQRLPPEIVKMFESIKFRLKNLLRLKSLKENSLLETFSFNFDELRSY